MTSWEIKQGDVLAVLRGMESESVQCVVTSPPYWGLRSYGTEATIWGGSAACQHKWGEYLVTDKRGIQIGKAVSSDARQEPRGCFCQLCAAWRGELGLEPTVGLYVTHIVEIFREIRRVLRKDGTVWANWGDSYAGANYRGGGPETANPKWLSNRGIVEYMGKKAPPIPEGLKPKDLCMIPARVALALQDDGWYLRSEITWCKRAPMPESVKDRPTSATEKIYLLTKSERYYYDAEAVREPATYGVLLPTFRGGGAYTNNQSFNNSNGPKANTAGLERPETTSRNQWNYWLLSPEAFPAAHFATFPTEIPRRAILAGTSERGCCPSCMAPWRRVVEREAMNHISRFDRQTATGGIITGGVGKNFPEVTRTTTDWQSSCKCPPHTPIPCTILDPFAGSGTTLMVALRLGRRAVGIELKPEYVEMATRRIRDDCPMFNTPIEASV